MGISGKIVLIVMVLLVLICIFIFYQSSYVYEDKFQPNYKHGDKLKKLSVAYSTTLRDPVNQQFIAEHFDMVLTGRTLDAAAYNIKQLNPDIIILGYYSASFIANYSSDWEYISQNHEDWFLHDINENRLESTYYPGTFLMNITSGWKDYYVKQCKDFLDNHSQYSGIFADNCNGQITTGQFTIPDDDIPQYIWDNRYDWIHTFINYSYNIITEEGTNNRIFLTNSGRYSQFCEEITGYYIWEGFVHGRGHDSNSYGYDESYLINFVIPTVNHPAKEGKIINVISDRHA